MDKLIITVEEKNLIQDFMDDTFSRVITWNDLMPVVDKIEKYNYLEYFDITIEKVLVFATNPKQQGIFNLTVPYGSRREIKTKKLAIFKAVFLTIEWLNKQENSCKFK